MINNEDSAQLSEYCFNTCETLKITIQGKNADDLDESVRVALEDLGGYVYYPSPNPPLSRWG